MCALIRLKHDKGNVDTEIKIRPGYMYGNKSEWKTNLHSECGNCSDEGNCLDGDWLEGKHSICRNSGCGMPSTTHFQGNMLSTGSLVRKYCSDNGIKSPLNTTIAACAENGTWLEDQKQHCEWSFFNGSYYHIPKNRLMTWFDAKALCESLSGHLVDIYSEEEQTFLEGMLDAVFWTGGNDLNEEGDWRWVDNSTMSEYTNWFGYNPSNTYGKEHCMVLHKQKSYAWNDEMCSKRFESICEK